MLKEGNRAHIETKLELIFRRKEKRSSEHGGQRRCRAQSVSKQPRQTLGLRLVERRQEIMWCKRLFHLLRLPDQWEKKEK